MKSRVRKQIYNPSIKNRAEQLRQRGSTYSQIYRKLKIPKSTLSTWFGNKYVSPFQGREAQLDRLSKARDASIALFKKRREDKLALIRTRTLANAKKLTANTIIKKAILSMLYWTEGTKSDKSWGVRFTNTDPELCRLFVQLLRECYLLDEKRFSIKLYLHYYHPIKGTRNFWSKHLNIPTSQFQRVYIKKRSITKRFRKNFRGICFVNYFNNDLKKELTESAYAFKDKLLSPSFNG